MNTNYPLKVSLEASHYVRDFCRSFSKQNVVNFIHDITFGRGEISMLMMDAKMLRFYFDNKIPIVCSDESGRTLANGLYTNQLLDNKHKEYTYFMRKLRQKAQISHLNYGKNSLHYVVRETDRQHMYSVFFDCDNDDFLHFVINNGAFIHDLINNYNTKSHDIISEASASENRISLPSAHDVLLSKEIPPLLEHDLKPICVTHRFTGLPMHLPSQRGRCLWYLIQGKSTKAIAQAMQLSPKTIEHYLEIIRKELGCRSSKELITFYAHQLI